MYKGGGAVKAGEARTAIQESPGGKGALCTTHFGPGSNGTRIIKTQSRVAAYVLKACVTSLFLILVAASWWGKASQ